VKRWQERGYDPNQDERDAAPQGPLWVEPLVPRRRRSRYGLPVLIAVFVVLAFFVATISRIETYFGAGATDTADTATPQPTPIAWLATTVAPTTPAGPTETVSAVPGAATPSPQLELSISAAIPASSYMWSQGTVNHFILELTNTAQGRVSLNPCPTYRMYIVGTDISSAPLRLLNCDAIGPNLQPGQSVALDMVYTPTPSDPLGPNQTLVWEWVSPDTIQAIATVNHVYITP
jgi:hypothetical protein